MLPLGFPVSLGLLRCLLGFGLDFVSAPDIAGQQGRAARASGLFARQGAAVAAP
jgi:hypothetical protein